MNWAPNENRTHSCRFASLPCLTITPLEVPVASHRAGSFVCVAGSSVIFSEDLPCWNVHRIGRERGLSSLLAGCSLLFIIHPTNARMWHKAVFKVGPVAGPKPTRVWQGQKYLRPRRHSPYYGRLRRQVVTPPKGIKAR